MVAEQLRARQQDVVVVDNDGEMIAEAQVLGYLTLDGDATDEDVLLSAGVGRARVLVTALSNDAANVFITLTSRNLNQQLQIIARSEHQSTQKKLLQAGANRVVLPEAIGAARIATMITHPSTVELMEFVDGRSVLDVEVAELRVAPTSPLAGRSIGETDIRNRHQLLVVGVKQAIGEIVFNPGADFQLRSGDILILMGRVDDLERSAASSGYRAAAPSAKPQQRVFLAAAAEHDCRFGGQLLGAELRSDALDAAIVDVGPSLLHRAPGVALGFGQAGFDQGVDDVQARAGQPVARQFAAGHVGKNLGQAARRRARRSRRRRRSRSPAELRPGRRRREPAGSVLRPAASDFPAPGLRLCARRRAARFRRRGNSVRKRRHLPASASSTLNQY